jgi:hypothetical protein
MITGAIKGQMDQIWNAFWSGGAIIRLMVELTAPQPTDTICDPA